jgi:hypothetical protein
MQQADIMRLVASNVEGGVIANSGHWIMEEQPAATVKAVRDSWSGNEQLTAELSAPNCRPSSAG